MPCAQKANAAGCPCTYSSCERRGACCQCVAHHRAKDEMVACYFQPEVERTHVRSMRAFLSQFQ